MEPTLKFIGKIHSELKNLEDCPRQESESAPKASLEIFSEFLEAARDIKKGDVLVLLTWLHRGDRDEMETRPRNNPNAPLLGVFSTRSPNRPNPIGLHEVMVVSVTNGLINVSSLEVLDQTPIIDIKPKI
jgi:tRNA-Thr(GGU) m(6)t(6)A37 methyltransferase TsaA